MVRAAATVVRLCAVQRMSGVRCGVPVGIIFIT